ncbi:MAG: TetR/AcrR family transcriptional regulator [Pseudomonadota bacterium]
MAVKATYHHGDLRNALLDAADELLQREGLQGFTLRACARLAQVSHAAPKHHFGDVNGLLRAVAERGYARLVEQLETHIEAVRGDLQEEMFATARGYVTFAEEYPEHFRIMFRSDLMSFDMSCPPESVAATFTALTNVILRQRGEAEIKLEDMPGIRSQALVNDILIGWCNVHGYAHLRLEGQLASMVPEEDHLAQLRTASFRLSELIQNASRDAKN